MNFKTKKMDLEKVNEALSNLDNIRLKEVSSKQPGNYWSEKYQGETSIKEVVYDLEDGSGLFLKITYETDSYGSNERITAIKFAKPVTKTITAYE